jgi:hypothetical protein
MNDRDAVLERMEEEEWADHVKQRNKAALIEQLAALEHEQWLAWSHELYQMGMWRENWVRCWVPYDQLPEDEKEKDRVWARMVLAVVEAQH